MFVVISGVSLAVAYLASYVSQFSALKASDSLNGRAVAALAAAPLRFFDENPAGRVLNRFSKDLAVLDAMLPLKLGFMLQLFWQSVVFLLLSLYALPWLIIAALPLAALLVLALKYGLVAAADSLRLESMLQSPAHSLLAVVLGGALPSFRARLAHLPRHRLVAQLRGELPPLAAARLLRASCAVLPRLRVLLFRVFPPRLRPNPQLHHQRPAPRRVHQAPSRTAKHRPLCPRALAG